MLVHRLDQVLARTDPFDLAQALERYIRAMSADRIRALVIDARDRMGAYYRAEFVRLLEEYRGIGHVETNDLSAEHFTDIVRKARGDEALQHAFARLLKSNLRAIPVFGGTFTEAILENVPSDRAVGIGEESSNVGMRAAVLGGLAVALVFAGAVGEHVIANVRAQSVATPLPAVAAPVVSVVTPQPRATARASHAVAIATAVTPTATPAPVPSAAVPAPPPIVPVAAPTRAPATRNKHTPPPAQGVATIAVPNPTPTPEPTALDVSDMPDAFTDATPLPQQTAAAAEVPHKVSLKTPAPTPKPRSHSWFKRAILHLDPFKPHP